MSEDIKDSIVKAHGLEEYFSQLPNDLIYDYDMSNEVLGTLVRILARPKDWKICVNQIIESTRKSDKHSGKNTVYKSLNRLIDLGYMERVVHRDSSGSISSSQYRASFRRDFHKSQTSSLSQESHQLAPQPQVPPTVTLQREDIYKEKKVQIKEKEIYKEKNESFPEEQKKTSSTELVEVKNASKNDLKAQEGNSAAKVRGEYAWTFSSLLNEGLSEKDAKDWIQVMKRKKVGPMNERTFHKFMEEVKGSGLAITDAVQFAVDCGWARFVCKWYLDRTSTNTYGNSRASSPYWAQQEENKRKEDAWINEGNESNDKNVIDV